MVLRCPSGKRRLIPRLRDSTKNVRISNFKLDVSDEALTVIFTNGAEISASWDGSLTCGFIDSPFPDLGAYAATARFIHENLLEVHIHC